MPCGKHNGIIHYTVGQRKGLGIALGRPVFIREIDAKTNRIYLADSGNEYFSKVILEQTTTVSGRPLEHAKLQAKIRSMAIPCDAEVLPLADHRAEVRFDQPQRATAKGQSVVLYDGDIVVGGGFIAACE